MRKDPRLPREPKLPVTAHIYMGSGQDGMRLLENIRKRTTRRKSFSQVVLDLLRKADPTLFKGVYDDERP